MKKFSYILFISVYLVFNVGISITTHFCSCEIDSTVSMNCYSTAVEDQECQDGHCNPQFCSRGIISVKVTDFHKAETNKKISSPSEESQSFFQSPHIQELAKAIADAVEFDHAYSSPPTYLNNCTFLI